MVVVPGEKRSQLAAEYFVTLGDEDVTDALSLHRQNETLHDGDGTSRQLHRIVPVPHVCFVSLTVFIRGLVASFLWSLIATAGANIASIFSMSSSGWYRFLPAGRTLGRQILSCRFPRGERCST
jgi:hypothetical protein